MSPRVIFFVSKKRFFFFFYQVLTLGEKKKEGKYRVDLAYKR